MKSIANGNGMEPLPIVAFSFIVVVVIAASQILNNIVYEFLLFPFFF